MHFKLYCWPRVGQLDPDQLEQPKWCNLGLSEYPNLRTKTL